MAPMSESRSLHAFGLPAGSIRAVLALAVFGGVWALLLGSPDRRIPEYLQSLMFIILGHYFAARGKPAAPGTVAGPNPLYLPRGAIRLVFVAGFATVAVLLHQRGRIVQDDVLQPGALTLILVFGFLLGVGSKRLLGLVFRGDRPLPRIIDDLRAAVAIVAVGLLMMIVFDLWRPAAPFGLPQFIVEDGLAATVGFYFGARS